MSPELENFITTLATKLMRCSGPMYGEQIADVLYETMDDLKRDEKELKERGL